MMSEKFSQLFSRLKILVVGDVMLDHYINGSVSRISPEAPVPILLRNNESFFLGGAGNVFSNILSLGGNATLMSVVGNDSDGQKIIKMLSEKSTTEGILISEKRITTSKTRFIGNNFQMLRVDNENCEPISDQDKNWILFRLEKIVSNFDCVVIEDYNKGVLTPDLISKIISICSDTSTPIIVDPKIENVEFFKGSTFLKPNFSEFCKIVGKDLNPQDFDRIFAEASDYVAKMDLLGIYITLSEFGMLYCDRNKFLHSKGYPISVSDVSGAGDTVTAMLSLCFSAGFSVQETLNFCNLAGSIACSNFGAVSVSLEEVIRRMS